MMLRNNQIKFLKLNGINLDFNNLSDDDIVSIEEKASDILQTCGFDKKYEPNAKGEMCESILDSIQDM